MTFAITPILDAVITILSGSAVLGSGAVSRTSYQPLETSSSAAAFIRYADIAVVGDTFGDTLEETGVADVVIAVEYYVRDTGNIPVVIGRVTSLTDAAMAAILQSSGLGSTVDIIRGVSFRNSESSERIFGGQTWLRFDGTITARVLNL